MNVSIDLPEIEGFEYTGECRSPCQNEWFINNTREATQAEFNYASEIFLILKKKAPIYATLAGQFPSQTSAGSGEWVDRKALEAALTMLSGRTLSNDELRMYDALKEVVIS